MTQALDIGVFARCKSLMMSNQKYVINLHELDERIVEDIEAYNRREELPPKRGKLLGQFIQQFPKAFHEATSPVNVVSAFEQAGICSRSDRPDPYMVHHKPIVDRARARLVVDELGLFVDAQPVEEPRHSQLKIDDLHRELQRVDTCRTTNTTHNPAPTHNNPAHILTAQTTTTHILPATHIIPATHIPARQTRRASPP